MPALSNLPSSGFRLRAPSVCRLDAFVVLFAGLTAVFSGLFIAYFCYLAGYAAIYYLTALLLIILLPLIVFSRENPARFAFLLVAIGLPAIAYIVPPGRFGISVFDYSMIFVLLAEAWRRVVHRRSCHSPMFPSSEWRWILFLMLPVVALAYSRGVSAWAFIEICLIYVFFLATLRELETNEGAERLFLLLALSTVVLAIGTLIERVAHINLSMSSANLNQLSNAGGMFIHRAGGFFQDPQKAAQFFSCAALLLFSIAIGRPFSSAKIRLIVILAAIAAICALFLTASRAAFLAAIIVIPAAILFATRSGAAAKLVSISFVSLAVLTALLIPTETLIDLLPTEIASRLPSIEESMYVRMKLWFDTWDMFADHPLTGVGLGGFKSYLIAKNPGLHNYMGMGSPLGGGYIPDQPESGYFKILYEGGIIGSLAATLLVLATLYRATQVILSPVAPQAWKAEVVGAMAALLVFAMTFATLFTLSDEKNVVILVLPLAVIWARSIALNAVIGANAVVICDVAPNSVVAGVPAKVIR